MVQEEKNKEYPAELVVKDQQILKQEYELLEFVINVVEEFKKIVKNKKGACDEYCRRVLSTCNRCQNYVEKRLDMLEKHEFFLKHLQDRYREDE